MRILLACAALIAAAPAFAADPVPAVPRLLDDAARAQLRTAFDALHARNWTAATAAADALPAGELAGVVRVQLALARGAPALPADAIAALAVANPDLAEAPALVALARAKGATALPALPAPQPLYRAAGATKRLAARPNRGDAALQRLAGQAQPLLKAGDVATAEALVEAAGPALASEALTEWRQRIAWGWLQAGDDAAARRTAEAAATGAGEWAVQAAWVAGLAAWRGADYPAAAAAFDRVARNAGDGETSAAGYFWAARAATAGGQADQVSGRLRAAARSGETFYGLLAADALGLSPGVAAAAACPDLTALLRHPDLRAAAAAREIGEVALADALIRQQARIGAASEHGALIAFAAALDLPATQVWLSQNAPAGTARTLAARYPMPGWGPSGGWRVDRALLYAHALQESQLRVDAVSPVGARGLMQIMPATARLVARHRGDAADMATRLDDPALSFEYGQTYLEELAGHWGTNGLLPKVIAAYNAGPNNVAAWNARAPSQQDPLLFIETIPFAETRAYVAIVLRNYWMYQRETGAATPSLALLAQGRWPMFPSPSALRTAARTSGTAAY